MSQFKDAFESAGYDTAEVLVEALESQEEVHQAFRETAPLQGNRAKIWVAIRKEQKLKKLSYTLLTVGIVSKVFMASKEKQYAHGETKTLVGYLTQSMKIVSSLIRC